MHIFIPWWLAAALPLVIGVGTGLSMRWNAYDFISPLLAVGSILIGSALTVGIFIGHFV